MAYLGRQPLIGNFVKLDAITTSATATYNLTNGGVAYFPQTANNCIVSLNGVIQSPTSAYTISGSTIVFSDALTASDSIDFILVLGDVLNIGTPSDSTVGFAKVTSNLITGATAETSIAGGDSVLIYDDSASALRKMTRTNFVAGVGGTNTPAFLVAQNSDQSIAASTSVELTWGTEHLDTDNAFASNRFTVPSGKAGLYCFTLTIQLNGQGTAAIIAIKRFDSSNNLYTSGGGNADGELNLNATANAFNMSVTYKMEVGDYVVARFYQTNGTQTTYAPRTFFGGHKIIT